ncbi:RNA-binding protein 25 [Elysia marginata]|uniref:RNA-binding protein 25 n=1 Tax=Elysia marginata TaxID=1093978 RepID=A0AAV4FSP0_9GAST|nr:RNA-binding protein 25 [Elysia marginata]
MIFAASSTNNTSILATVTKKSIACLGFLSMSFPGRAPMGMPGGMPGGMPAGMPGGVPGMAPRMMPQGFAFPMGTTTLPGMNPMMPMQMMAPMMRPMNMMATQLPPMQMQQQQQIKQNKKLVPQEISKTDSKEEKPPVTTVFLGNISERAPDTMIKQMLQRCGNVLSWKRVQGASGKLQAFGFCEYEDPEATLRCIRLLNEWQIADKKLMVKVETKTKTLLEEYRKKKRGAPAASPSASETPAIKKEKTEDEEKEKKEENGEADSEDKKENGSEDKKEEEEPEEELDEDTQREDRVATAGLEAIMREYASKLAVEPSKPSDSSSSDKEKVVTKKDKDLLLHAKDTGFDDMEMEDEKREIINREINKFRDRHKDDDEDKERDSKDRERSLAREREHRRQEEKRQRERLDRMREQQQQQQRERERERERDRDRESSSREHRGERGDRGDRTSSRVSRSRSKRKEKEIEEEEEAYERRKLEKKLREKEAAYQEAREGRRLKEFLEDYDDLRDDPKFYKGTALMRRVKEREKEKELDNRDRQREKEEFEEIKRKLFDEGHPDAETEVARMEREREEHLQPRLHLQEIKQPALPKVASPPESDSSDAEPLQDHEHALSQSPLRQQEESEAQVRIRQQRGSSGGPPSSQLLPPPGALPPQQVQALAEHKPSPSLSTSPISTDSRISAPGPGVVSPDSSSLPAAPISAATAPAATVMVDNGKRKKFTIGEVFNQDDDENMEPKKRKLVPLDYDEDKTSATTSPAEKKAATAEEKRQKIKQLIDSIPTGKDELYAFTVDWDIVDQNLMDKRIKPWVTKKIIEYIGEEEPTLTEFICQKVVAKSTPQSIQNDVAMILDEEAEVFVVKMWRLLVYETEAKKLGLVK